MGPIIQNFDASNEELAAAGLYFTAKNPTVGAGLATIAAPTTISDLTPFAMIKGPTTPGKAFWVDYIKLICTAPGTGGTKLYGVIHTDATKADPTGGTQLVLHNTNQLSTNVAETKIFAGPLSAAASSGAVQELVAPLLKNAIPAIADVYMMKFGGSDLGVSASAAIVYYGGPPLVVPANEIATLHLLIPGQTAASSYEIEIGGSERST